MTNGNVQGNMKDPNPNYFKRVVGEGHPYSEGTSGTKWGGVGTFSTIVGKNYLGGNSSDTFISPDYGRTQDRALEKVYDQIRGNSNLVIDLAESAMTLKMLRSTLNFRRFASDFFTEFASPTRRRGMSRGQSRLDYVTGKWLEYRYGWLPLVHSVYDAMDNLSKKTTSELITVKARSGYRNEARTVSGTGSYNSPRIVMASKISVRTEYGLKFHLPAGTQIYDWTTLNPASIVWELLPLSFVADWFVNVSQQLSLLENYWLFNSRFRGGYRTNSHREVIENTNVGITNVPRQYWPNGTVIDNSQYEKWVISGYTKTVSQKDRQILFSLPLPSGFRFNVKVGAARQLDAAALIHQLFAKKLRF